MSENFECDFSEGSLNEKREIFKKRQNEKEINTTNMNYSNINNLKPILIKEDSQRMKSSKLSKKNLKYFLIYYDGNFCNAVINNILNERRLEIFSSIDIDLSKNVYFMMIDFKREIVEGICKKEFVKENSDDLSKKRIYKLRLEIKSR